MSILSLFFVHLSKTLGILFSYKPEFQLLSLNTTLMTLFTFRFSIFNENITDRVFISTTMESYLTHKPLTFTSVVLTTSNIFTADR